MKNKKNALYTKGADKKDISNNNYNNSLFSTKNELPSTVKQAALWWLDFGLNVIPIAPKEKITTVKWADWLDGLDHKKIEKHWSKNPKHELGAIVDNSLLILDADSKQSISALYKLEKAFDLEPNLIVTTSRGEHHYFKRAENSYATTRGYNSKKFPQNIDVKTGRSAQDGRSMIVLAPSTGKTISINDADSCNGLIEVDQTFIDAVFKHNGDDVPREYTKTDIKLLRESTEHQAVLEYLSYIKPDLGYDDWLKVLMGVHANFNGSDDGLYILDEWSKGADNYCGFDHLEYKYRGFDQGGKIQFGTVIHFAEQAGADIAEIKGKFCTDVINDFDTLSKLDDPRFPDVIYTKTGMPKVINTSDNLNALIAYKGYKCRFNMMTYSTELTYWDGELTHYSMEQIDSILISEASRFQLPKDTIKDHFIAIAQNKPYHPIREWLEKDKWDGISRVSKVISCLNAKEPVLAEIAIRSWLIACIASLYESRFSSKLIPVLQGGQSFKKTAFVKRLGNVLYNAFLEGAELDPDRADSVITCIYSWIVELGELERTSKNSQGSLKAFITKEVDKVRPPYFKRDIIKPRQTHFIATVNESDFLKDKTGSSRYAVIEMNRPADLETVNDLLGWEYKNGKLTLKNETLLRQFWLEVKHFYEVGESWMLKGEIVDQFEVINAGFQSKNKWYEYIINEHSDAFTPTYFQTSFFNAKELVLSDQTMTEKDVAQVGIALSQLANDGLAMVKTARGNKKLYKLE